MDDEGRLDARHWDAFEQCVNDNPGLKLMSVLGERDAAILDRDTALAEKKAAYAEREAAFLQRDVAFADRSCAISERDAAAAALDYAQENSWNGQRSMPCGTLPSAKCLHILSGNTAYGANEYQAVCAIDADAPVPASEAPSSAEKPASQKKGDQGLKESSSKRKSGGSSPKTPRPKQPSKDDVNGQLAVAKHEQKNQDLVIGGNVYDISSIPIPVCSCTGILQQCYRWGNGGWQSACCTTSISMYPLPMNPKRRGARLAGRKMSGGAFRKVVERLGAEGRDLAYPIDLKTYWAKHGTNKFVTIR